MTNRVFEGIAAAVLTAVAVGVWWGIHAYIGVEPIITALVPVVAIAAYIGGRSPGLVATVTAMAGATALLSRDGLTPTEIARVGLLGVNGVTFSLLSGWLLDARCRAERERQRFAMAFDHSPLPQVMIRSADLQLIAVNEACAHWLGATAPVLPTMTLADIAIAEGELAMLRGRIACGAALDRERIHVGGRMVLVSCGPILIEGEPHALAVFDDVTEREQAETARRESEQRFAAAFDACPLPYAMMRMRDRVMVAANDPFLAYFGYAREQVVGRCTDAIEFYPFPAERQSVRSLLERDHRVREVEHSIRKADGAIRTIRASIETVTIDGEVYGLSVFADVTEQQHAVRELRASEERFAAAFDASPLAKCIVRVDDCHFVAVNDAYVELLGYSRDELIEHATSEFPIFPDPTDRCELLALAAPDGGIRRHEIRIVNKACRSLDVMWSVTAVELAGMRYLYVSLEDITDRKRAEGALRESEARFRELAENIREVFWLYDAALDQVVYVSPAYESVWQRSAVELANDPKDWIASIHSEDRERVRAASGREDYDQQYRIVRPDGTVRWIHDRAFPVRDASGHVIRIAGVAEDITERRALEDQLRQTQKMESLGMLAGGVAHDFNNLLAVIAASSGMLGEAVAAGTEQRELVDEIDGAVQRAASLTRQLLAFSRKQVAAPKVVDVNAAVHDTRKMLRRMVGEDVLLQTSLVPDVRAVRVDPGYLVQVLMNLTVNARDAMPRGGTVEISTRNEVLDEAFARTHLGAPVGPVIVLSVTDTGSGIPADVIGHIFEPFFTTKEQGKGTGMGLSVVHGIVEQAGGFIDVESELGKGTTFRVYLPAIDGDADVPQEISRGASNGFETILFVDDDEYVRRAAARALRSRGYNVIEAPDGGSALGQMCDGIDLLLTDVVMPRMDGRELAEAARDKLPGLKVLYTSGYTDDAVVRHGILHGDVDMLEKPFRIDALAARVRQALDR